MSASQSSAELKAAADLIRQGKLVAFPTETVYGLGANALDEGAVRRIYAAKGRPWASPLIVHVADEAMARALCLEWPDSAAKLASVFWPGPLTMVVHKSAVIPDVVTAGLATVGIRIPQHPVALELIRLAGVPIAAPSANRFTEISPTTAEHVRQSLGSDVDLILDGGPTTVGIESTVVSLHRHPPVLLRPGMITQEQIESVSGMQFEHEPDRPEIVESPGQHPRHYAPRTHLVLLSGDSQPPPGQGRIIHLPSEANGFAQRLYAELHQADMEGWEWIAVQLPAQTGPEWTGILDRLRRAATIE